MRINQFVAQATGLSRRSVDSIIIEGRVRINNKTAILGETVRSIDEIYLDNKKINTPRSKTTILINKPAGYVCSRDGQGSPTIYDLIPKKYHTLKHIGRIDKDSSGLVVLTDDGDLAHKLSHPKFNKVKVYVVRLNKPLNLKDKELVEDGKIILERKPSIMKIQYNAKNQNELQVEIYEGRNRQIRRTFLKLNYEVVELHRTQFGKYNLSQLGDKTFLQVN